ncbi:hypothetical protein ACFOGJ_24355 [Marinibaculum pumilum]|uniref:Antitoxin VbhA domain-containing protein n=1 Tax=Marinibaculum pumilum TaxID=1766165 RepID=A0ABV7L780_9PROT
MAQPLAYQLPDAAAAEPAEDRDAARRLADFDRAKFASEVAGHVISPEDDAAVRALIRQGLTGDELVAAALRHCETKTCPND